MSKRDVLLRVDPRAKSIPTFVISINAKNPEHRALIDAGLSQRRVIWLRTWDNDFEWCSARVKEIKPENPAYRIILPIWKSPPFLEDGWWASGLLRACQSFLETGNFELRELVLPSMISQAPIGLFSNTRNVKSTWCFTEDIMSICLTSNATKWSDYVDEEKNAEIISKVSALCHILVCHPN
jgi:hypothetical protein